MWWIAHDGLFYTHPNNPDYTLDWDGTRDILAALGMIYIPPADGCTYVTDGKVVKKLA
jgi:hypothetical protein